jgi:hypothetical protein
MIGPEFIDNRNGNTLAAALAAILSGTGSNGGLQESAPPGRLDIASAFFSPAGFSEIVDHLNGLEKIRLMLGAEPPLDSQPPRRRLDETQAQFERRLIREGIAHLEAGLREERDRLPFLRSSRAALRRLIDTLASGRMETRRYERAVLHAKAYIFAPADRSNYGGAGVIAGSSNLTRAGVTRNLELNLGRYDDPVVAQAQAWFDELWEEAVPFDLTELLGQVFAEWTPFEIFLRVLFQLYGGEIEELTKKDEGLPLTSFQKHGAARALRLIEEIGGAIVADEVGLGKTFIAGEIMDLYLKRRQRCLLVCPAQLRDTTWAKFRSAHFLGDVECLSYEELAIDRQIAMAEPEQFQDKLERPLKEYQLVVVDEAHNYRNPDAPTRAAVLRKLLWGQRRDVLLLTATPVNNSLWDLYHLLRFFVRQDAFLADRGILSIKERFDRAAREDPAALSPDVLYPIIDATTVKRTRQFVKKHYGGDTITLPDGRTATIVFPTPQAITVRYKVSGSLSALFDQIEVLLDPDQGSKAISFARYTPDLYLIGNGKDDEEEARAAATVGLLRSGLLKRFESSAHAFDRTLAKLIDEHRSFLAALDKGHVVTTRFLRELAASDETSLDDLLAGSAETSPAGRYKIKQLREAVAGDLAKLERLQRACREITPDVDPKLAALISALERIAEEAEDQAINDDDARQKRKVIIFSFFADTVAYLRQQLGRAVATNRRLAPYADRVVAVAGSAEVEPTEFGRMRAVAGFAPISTEATDPEDRFDILIATDVLAEGVNLQQCRHIINFDVPWNPMRLVQRHGRVDRIGSPHPRVFLRTIFPADRLDQLLNLEQRILQKIALAAASVGVVSPVQGGTAGSQVFTETREEIERLLREDPSLFERGGTASGGQTGEEYRQTLRKALAQNPATLRNMPWGIGSGMAKGSVQGVFFCASVGERTYLRFLPTGTGWRWEGDNAAIQREVGTCLRLIECDEATPRLGPPELEDAVFDLWPIARDDIWSSWMFETDPANLQPKVRPLNQRVAEFIRGNRPPDDAAERVNRALDILEAPWPRREEILLREWFNDESSSGVDKARTIIARVLETGLEPFNQPQLLPPIERDAIRLVCWLGITPDAAAR